MRIIKYCLFILLSITLFTACKPDAKPKKKGKAKTAQSAKKKKKGSIKKADKYVAGQKQLALTPDQTKRWKAIDASYAKRINGLKKSKKWDGKANAATRTKTQTAKTTELKKLFGSKYAKFQSFTKNWGKKPAKKKKPANKKKPASKKKAGSKK